MESEFLTGVGAGVEGHVEDPGVRQGYVDGRAEVGVGEGRPDEEWLDFAVEDGARAERQGNVLGDTEGVGR